MRFPSLPTRAAVARSVGYYGTFATIGLLVAGLVAAGIVAAWMWWTP